MSKKHKTYTTEFKAEAIKLIVSRSRQCLGNGFVAQTYL